MFVNLRESSCVFKVITPPLQDGRWRNLYFSRFDWYKEKKSLIIQHNFIESALHVFVGVR
jgi:hypothetical protein